MTCVSMGGTWEALEHRGAKWEVNGGAVSHGIGFSWEAHGRHMGSAGTPWHPMGSERMCTPVPVGTRELRAAEGRCDSPADNFPKSPEQLDQTMDMRDILGTHVSLTQAEDASEATAKQRAKAGGKARVRRQLLAPESQRNCRSGSGRL